MASDGDGGPDDGSSKASDAESGEEESGSDGGDESNAEEARPPPDDKASILKQRTLILGELPTPSTPVDESSSEERLPDSQVSSGWLGQAYNRESRRAHLEKEQKQKQLIRESNQRLAKEPK